MITVSLTIVISDRALCPFNVSGFQKSPVVSAVSLVFGLFRVYFGSRLAFFVCLGLECKNLVAARLF
jgi:hypothetical protein